MRLTQYTDYSLRVLIYLGLRGDRPSTIREIARSYGISRNHLMKVVHRLGRFGYIDTLRGRGGGIRLSKAAPDIRIGEVVRKTEENWTLVECFDLASNTCRIDPVCTLKHAIGKALSSFYSVLDRYTLEDVLQHRKALSTILQVERSPRNHGRSAEGPHGHSTRGAEVERRFHSPSSKRSEGDRPWSEAERAETSPHPSTPKEVS